jgi:hypothetical protein
MCVAFVIQNKKHMRRITLSPVSCLSLPEFSTLSHKRYDFRKEERNTKCVFWFSLQLLSETFLILRRDIAINVKTFFLSDFNKTCLSSTYFGKNWHIKFNQNPSNKSQDVPCRRTEGRTDMRKLIITSRSYMNYQLLPVKLEVAFASLKMEA